MRDVVRAGLAANFPEKLVDVLLEAFEEAKRNFYLSKLRPSEVEGGRFCEAAFRMCQHAAFGSCDPLGKRINTERVRQDLESKARAPTPDSVRLHVPRALRVVYDVRSNRDAVHLADGIDPNLQDATLVVSVLSWVMAEFVRLSHNVSADEAQRMVEELVTRAVPAVEDFDGFPKVLRTKIKAGDFCLILLYKRGKDGATFEQLNFWVVRTMRGNLRATLTRLDEEKRMIHFDGTRYQITRTGIREVESRRLVEP